MAKDDALIGGGQIAKKKKASKKKGPSEDKSTAPDENKGDNKKKGNDNGKGNSKGALSPSEAIYGFVGWLTSRPKKVSMSANRDAAPVVELVDQFCKANKLKAPGKGWNKKLAKMEG